MKHIHILGICGTFMGSLAILARQKGYRVTGCDQNVYPPMSTYLAAQGVEITQGYGHDIMALKPDTVIVGNSMVRGMAIVETLLNSSLNYTSGPQWLYQEILQYKKVIAVSGTHGKTTTASLLTKLLEHAGLNPSFLIGGITQDFGVSSRLTDSQYFVIEADEYDTAFFDKRSKFIHYTPSVLLINNLEFDHADIFSSIEDIYRQFHYLIRTMPGNSTIIYPETSQHIMTLLAMGVWSKTRSVFGSSACYIEPITADYSQFTIVDGNKRYPVKWNLLGSHNAQNALMAYVAVTQIGLDFERIKQGFSQFKGVKRRLEIIYQDHKGIIYDDFAHHPTAVEHALRAIKAKAFKGQNVIAVLEPRSNTMIMGVHANELMQALLFADEVFFYQNNAMKWDVLANEYQHHDLHIYQDIKQLTEVLTSRYKEDDYKYIVIMSNGGFEGLHDKLLQSILSSSVLDPHKVGK